MKQVIVTPNAPAAIGPYSQGIAAGQTVYVSGQLPIDPATGLIPEGIAAQTAQSLKNIQAILAQQEMTLANVVKTTVFLADINDFCRDEQGVRRVFCAALPRAQRGAGGQAAQGRSAGDRVHCCKVSSPAREEKKR